MVKKIKLDNTNQDLSSQNITNLVQITLVKFSDHNKIQNILK